MVFNMRPITKQISNFWGMSVIDNANKALFVRFQSILAQKLIYSEYGDASKVVRQETDTLSDPKANEVGTNSVHFLK